MKTSFVLLLTLILTIPAAVEGSTGGRAYPLRVADDGRGLVDANGGPVFLHGDTPWHIFARLDREETLAYLDDRSRRGFDALLVALIVSDGYTGTTRNAFGEEPFLVEGDFSMPNEAYFAHVDWAMQEAMERGMMLFVVPAYLGYACGIEGWCEVMRAQGVEAMRAWGRWVGGRYREQPNILWVHGGDVDASAFGADELNEAVVQGILDVDDRHLHSSHCSRRLSAADCYDRPWLQVNSTYSDCTLTALHIRNDLLRSPRRPFFYIEGFYEGENNATTTCLRWQAYTAMLGGAFAHFYGSGQLWDFPADWVEGLESAGARSMSHLGALLRSRPWERLEPDTDATWVVGDRGPLDSSEYVSAARARDGSWMIAYLPRYRALTVDLRAISSENVQAWWFDPVLGTAVSIGVFATEGQHVFAPMADQDWVLVLDDPDAGFGPPGYPPGAPDSTFGGLKGSYRSSGR